MQIIRSCLFSFQTKDRQLESFLNWGTKMETKLIHWRVRSRILIDEKPQDGYPMRMWQLSILGVKDKAAMEFEDISYYVKEVHVSLHPTFENPYRGNFVQYIFIVIKPPFNLLEKGWGEFELKITLVFNHLGVPSHQFMAFLSFDESKGQGTVELVRISFKL